MEEKPYADKGRKMYYIGMDIGTTTISGLLIDADNGNEITRKTIANSTRLISDDSWKSVQSARQISEICAELVRQLSQGYEDNLQGIGITGQMHGILYVDGEGNACSDLVSWQDERGNLLFDDSQTYCQRIRQLTGCSVATGFGITTLFYDTVNGLVPKEATSICTITDYVAMRLAGRRQPLVHVSNAASLGLFSFDTMSFMEDKIASLGLDVSLLPEVTAKECIIGQTESGVLVSVAIGDNQASFLGSVGMGTDTLINIGTGNQISRLSAERSEINGVECRPFVNNHFLLVGAGLCGGSSYSLLVRLFTEAVTLITEESPGNIIKIMDQAAIQALHDGIEPLQVDTRFRGTRDNSSIRGAISNISEKNFTMGNLCRSFLKGICEELYAFYKRMQPRCRPDFYAISGNAARNSKILRQMAVEVFGAEVRVPQNAEEAAYGAALLAIHVTEGRSWDEITKLVRYNEPVTLLA